MMQAKLYRMTFVIRILVTFTVLPIGILMSSGLKTSSYWDIFDYIHAIFCFSLIMLCIIIWLYHSSKKILVYNNQIKVQSLFGNKAVTLNEHTKITYSSIKANIPGAAGIYAGAVGGIAAGLIMGVAKNWSEDKITHINITVSDSSGQIRLNSNVKRIDQIRDYLIRFELSVILPTLKNQYMGGSPISFGPLTFHNKQISFNDKVINTADIAELAIRNGSLIIKEKGKWLAFLNVKSSDIPNINSLLTLLQS